MTNKNQIEIERLANQIAEYLARNPLAADSLAGIQNWWLAGATPHITSRDVERAVSILLQRGTLLCRVQSDGTKTYARAASAIN